MAKGKKSILICRKRGHEDTKRPGQCPACGEWNTFVEERLDSGVTKGTTAAARAVRDAVRDARVLPLTEVTANDDERCETGIRELDRVLGGGIVPGSLVLVGGDPGIGKSTLLLQVCQRMAQMKKSILTRTMIWKIQTRKSTSTRTMIWKIQTRKSTLTRTTIWKI